MNSLLLERGCYLRAHLKSKEGPSMKNVKRRLAEKMERREKALDALNDMRAAADDVNEYTNVTVYPAKPVERLLLQTACIEDWMVCALRGDL